MKRDGKPLSQMARELGVQAVVEGSVARIGDRVRVTAQLIQVEPEAHLWTEVYDRDIGDVVGLQSDVTQAIAAAIHVTLSPEDRQRLGHRRRVDPGAFETYLRARHYESGSAGLATERAIEAYRKAIERDPTFTAARAGLARAYIFGVGLRPKEALGRARATALEALARDPDAPEAFIASAVTRLYYDRDFEGAEQEFRRAVAADPGNPDAHFYYAHCLTAMGRFDQALDEARQALQLDPLSPLIAHYIGRIHYFARRYDQALAALDDALDIDPNYAFTHIFAASTHERMGQYDRALEHRQTYMTLNGAQPDEVVAVSTLARASGYHAALRRWVHDAAARAARRGYQTSLELTYLQAELGDVEGAFRWLEGAVEDHTRDLIYLKVEPGLDRLRGDPRFQDVLRRAIR